MNRRRTSLWICAILALALTPSAVLAWRFRGMPQLGAYHDDAIYLESAKSLATGQGYRIPSLPGNPYQTKYPPVTPFLLSLVWRLDPHFPANLPKITAFCWAPLPLYIFVIFRLARQWGFSPALATALGALAALSPHIALSALMTMSELVFGTLIVMAVLLLEYGETHEGALWFALAGVVGGLAFLTRTHGIVLLVTAPAYLVWRKRWRDAAIFAGIFIIPVVGWYAWLHLHAYRGQDPVSMFYLDYVGFYRINVHWGDLPGFLQTNLDSILTGAARLIYSMVDPSTLARMLAWVVAIGSGCGLVRLARRSGRMHLALFAGVFVVILLPWHWPPNERYLLPLWPALLAGLFCEIEHLIEMARANFVRPKGDRFAAAGILLAAAALCVTIVYCNVRGILVDLPAVLNDYQRIAEARKPGYTWIREHTPQQAQVLTYDDPLMYLYTGRSGYAMPIVHWIVYGGTDTRNTAYFRTAGDFMREHSLDYALVTEGDFRRDLLEPGRRQFTTALATSPEFEESFASKGASVYQLKSPATTASLHPEEWWFAVRDTIPAIR